MVEPKSRKNQWKCQQLHIFFFFLWLRFEESSSGLLRFESRLLYLDNKRTRLIEIPRILTSFPFLRLLRILLFIVILFHNLLDADTKGVTGQIIIRLFKNETKKIFHSFLKSNSTIPFVGLTKPNELFESLKLINYPKQLNEFIY